MSCLNRPCPSIAVQDRRPYSARALVGGDAGAQVGDFIQRERRAPKGTLRSLTLPGLAACGVNRGTSHLSALRVRVATALPRRVLGTVVVVVVAAGSGSSATAHQRWRADTQAVPRQH